MKLVEILLEATSTKIKDVDFKTKGIGVKYNLENYLNNDRISRDMGKIMQSGFFYGRWLDEEVTLEKDTQIAGQLYKTGSKFKVLGRYRPPEAVKGRDYYLVLNPNDSQDVVIAKAMYFQCEKWPVERKAVHGRWPKQMKDFNCLNCGKLIPKAAKGMHRNHCPYCLYSIHIETHPGTRDMWCGEGTPGDPENFTPSLLVPVGIAPYENRWSIVHQCEKCKEIKQVKIAVDDDKSKVNQLPKGVVRKEKVVIKRGFVHEKDLTKVERETFDKVTK